MTERRRAALRCGPALAICLVAFFAAAFLRPAAAAAPEAAADSTLASLERELRERESQLGPDHLACADSHDALVAAYTERVDFRAALTHAERAVAIRTLHLPADHVDLAISIQEVGYAHYRLEDYPRAVVSFQDALGRWLANPEAPPSDVVWCESDLAEMLRLAGRYRESEAALQSALARSRTDPGAASFLPVLVNNLGTFLWDQDRLDEAEPLLRESLELRRAEAPSDPLRVATAQLNLGVILRSQSSLVDAERHLAAALQTAREERGGENALLIHALNGLAGLYSLTSRFGEARALREEALEILARQAEPSHVLEGDILHALGSDLLDHDEVTSAERAFRRSLELRRQTLGDVHPAVGVALVGVARARARVDGIGDPEVGALLDEALERLRESPVAVGERARAQSLRARHLRATGQPALAREVMGEALETAEALRASRGGGDESRLAFLAEFRAAACELVDWLIEDGDVDAAFREAERIKARVLRDQIAAAGVNLRAGIPRTVLEPLEDEETAALVRVQELRRAMRQTGTPADEPERRRRLSSALDQALVQLQGVTDRIKLHSPAWKRVLRETAAEVTVESVRRLALRDGEALIGFQVGPSRSWAFVIPPGTGPLRAHALVGLTQATLTARLQEEGGLAALHRPRGASRGVTGVAPIVDVGSEPIDDTLLRELAQMLLPEEVRASLDGATGIVILPDGHLHAVPMEALILSDAGQPPIYWLDEGPPLRYAHSVSTLMREPTASGHAAWAPGRVASFADPAFMSGGQATPFPRLVGTAREADALAEAFGSQRLESYRGSHATERAFRQSASTCRWLHVATHALVEPQRNHWSSALVLAPDEAVRDDGFLHFYELLDMDLACEVAVLSACDTNAGRLVAGEGVFALSRGFLAAGAGQVMASLWPLHDDAAAELTGALFRDIARSAEAGSGAPIAAARYAEWLQSAKRTLRGSDRFSAPHFWAPFVLTVGAGAS